MAGTLSMCFVGCAALVGAGHSGTNATLWTLAKPSDRLAPIYGTATLDFFDPDATGWGPRNTLFGTASSLGLPRMTGGDAHVMRFPASTARQGYVLTHRAPPNGPFGETDGLVSNYSLIVDVLYPSASDGRWRALQQTNAGNENDAEFFVLNAPSGGVGTTGSYFGRIRPGVWHRVAVVVQAAPEEGKAQVFVDGRFAGGIGTTDSGLGVRWTLDPLFLLFTDGSGQTAEGYVSSVYFVDRAMRMDEIRVLGGPHAAGAATPGAPAPPPEQRLPKTISAIGHRGGFFCCAPDNTMAAVRQAIAHRIPVIELDTRLSADGVVVLMHDLTVDRTTNGSGPAAALTVAQLQALDAGSWFAPEFARERVPTLAEVMTEAKDKVVLYFDLKVPGQIDAIMTALNQTGFNPAHCWFWVHGDEAEARAIRTRLRDARIIWSIPPDDWSTSLDFFPSMRAAGVYGFDLGVSYVDANASFVRAAKAAGFIVSVHTVLDPQAMQRFADLGVDYIETDFPHIVRELQR